MTGDPHRHCSECGEPIDPMTSGGPICASCKVKEWDETRVSWHNEGGKGTTSYVAHFQIRPDPLAK